MFLSVCPVVLRSSWSIVGRDIDNVLIKLLVVTDHVLKVKSGEIVAARYKYRHNYYHTALPLYEKHANFWKNIVKTRQFLKLTDRKRLLFINTAVLYFTLLMIIPVTITHAETQVG